MREKEFANWLSKQIKPDGTHYKDGTITDYIRYIKKIEAELGDIDNERLSNSESYLEKIKTTVKDSAENSLDDYHVGASAYFRFRKSEEQGSAR